MGIEEFIKDINELIGYKKKYEYAIADKQKMSDALYELYLEKYNTQSFEERKQIYIKEWCRDCRNYDCDNSMIPENILMPIKDDKGWFPPRVSCKEFQWS